MHLLTSTKKSFSAKEVQRQLGHKRYEPIWYMLYKLRSVMGLRDDEYKLSDEVELDEGFFETVSIFRDKDEPLKRGRGSQRQTIVLVSIESKPVSAGDSHKKYNTKKKVEFLKMKVVNSLKKETIKKAVDSILEKGTKIVSDGSTSYVEFNEDYNLDSKSCEEKRN